MDESRNNRRKEGRSRNKRAKESKPERRREVIPQDPLSVHIPKELIEATQLSPAAKAQSTENRTQQVFKVRSTSAQQANEEFEQILPDMLKLAAEMRPHGNAARAYNNEANHTGSVANQAKIGFIGSSNTALSIVAGFINYAKYNGGSLIVCGSSNRALAQFAKFGCITTSDPVAVLTQINDPDGIIIVSLKPHDFIKTRQPTFNTTFAEFHGHIVSVMPSVRLDTLESILGRKERLLRSCPNSTVQVGSGVWPITCRKMYTGIEALLKVLSIIAFCPVVEERVIDIAESLGSSTVAFIYTIVQALTDGAVKHGIDRELAHRVIAHSVQGASRAILDTEEHPYVLRDLVCAPGSPCLYGTQVLEKHGIYSAMFEAVESVILRHKSQTGKED